MALTLKKLIKTINDIIPTLKMNSFLIIYKLIDFFFSFIANSMSKALKISSQLFKNIGPDLVILLGDRYEILSIASALLVTQSTYCSYSWR